jgi:hypothetical protein
MSDLLMADLIARLTAENAALRAALTRIAAPSSYGCKPCHHTDSPEHLAIEVEGLKDNIRATIAALDNLGGNNE